VEILPEIKAGAILSVPGGNDLDADDSADSDIRLVLFPFTSFNTIQYIGQMNEQTDVKAELKLATDRIVASKSRKKLVVAGPGAGKTYLFRELLKSINSTPDQSLVLTFINSLKGDLELNLGAASRVFTLHGYCQHLLRRDDKLRKGLSAKFRCYPGLRHLIPEDWIWIRGSDAPTFIKLMRDLNCTAEQNEFYLERSNYYDAVDFDDSVHRVLQKLSEDNALIPKYSLVLIDEFQDFNKMEASIIDLLADHNSIVIAGDDDQALYSQLRCVYRKPYPY
jgi:superfamily I DNA/RNA helicase